MSKLLLSSNELPKRYAVTEYFCYPFVDSSYKLVHNREQDKFYNNGEEIDADYYSRLMTSLKEGSQILASYEADIL